MTVREGMDTARARGVADQLRTQGDALDAIGAQGSAMMQVLEEAWSGPDTERFTGDWESARPQIDRAGQAVTNLSNELVRQADEQDATSDASGSGAAAAGPAEQGQPVASLPRLPGAKLPSFPDSFKKVGEILKNAWDAFKSAFTIPAWISDLMTWLDDAFKVLQKWPILRVLFKALGKATPIISALIGLGDVGVAIFRMSEEGMSDDAGMQLFEGILTTLSAGLGIAALFATGTVVGAPLGAVLGAGALIAGYYSILVGILREMDTAAFLREHPEAVHSGLPPDLVGQPASDSPITPPRFPRPDFPWSSSLPKPGLPGIPLPKLG